MAFDPAPTTLLGPGYDASSTLASLLISDFPQLTSAEAHESTGDVRKLLFAICERVANAYQALPAEDRPANMQIFSSSSTPNSAGRFNRTFTFSFNLAIGTLDVAAES